MLVCLLHQAFPLLSIYATEAITLLLLLNWARYKVDSNFVMLALRSPVEFQSGLSCRICFRLGIYPEQQQFYSISLSTGWSLHAALLTALSNSRLVEGLP